MRTEELRPYYDHVKKKWFARFWKRFFDIVFSLLLIVILSPAFLIISILVKTTSRGPVFFRQERVTLYCRHFRILKFRTMVVNAEKQGPQVTQNQDSRVTSVGRFLRKTRLDEIPQVFNVLFGQMSLVGARPEVPRYVAQYQPEWYATFLIRAGVTCEASIKFKDEEQLLKDSQNVEKDYVDKILPTKLSYDCHYIQTFNVFSDFVLLWKTFFSVI